MKNIIQNSKVITQSGNIHIGDNVINFHSFDEYKVLSSRKQLLENNLKEVNSKLNSYIKKQEEDKSDTILDFVEHLGLQIKQLNEDLENSNSEISKFENNLLSALNICFSENSLYDFDTINNLLQSGNIETANSKLVISELKIRREKLLQASNIISQNIHDVSRAFLLKAKTIQLQVENKNRYSDAYKAYLESIDTDRYLENLYEFALFLYEYRISESIPLFKEILVKYKTTIDSKKILYILNNLAFAQFANRDYEDALKTYEFRLKEAKLIEKKSQIISIDNILDIISSHKGIAHISQILSRDSTLIESHYDACFKLFSNIGSGAEEYDYTELLGDYANFIAKQNKHNLELPYKLLSNRCKILYKIAATNEDNRINFAYSLVDLSRVQTFLDGEHLTMAKSNLEDALKIAQELSGSITQKKIVLMTLIYHGLSRVSSRFQNTVKAISYMHIAIELSKMDLNSTFQSGAEAIAVFSTELSNLYKSIKDYDNYYKHRHIALNWLRKSHIEHPSKYFDNISGTYERLTLEYIDENSKPYLVELLSFYEYCKKNNPESDVLTYCIFLTKVHLGTVAQIHDKDRNKAKQIYLEVISKIGMGTDVPMKLSIPRNFAIDMLLRMNVTKIEVNGTLYGLVYDPKRHNTFPSEFS